MILRRVKLGTLGALRGMGAFHLVANSRWRQQRLLILCYHGIALEDEHLWRPSLYIDGQKLEERLSALNKNRCNVLPLEDALQKLRAGNLPPRSVVLTFDDGMYDFYRQAFPRLQSFGFPATVYLTTYYTFCERPIFNLMCSYLLWKRRGEALFDGAELGLDRKLDLRTEVSRHKIVRGLIEVAEKQNMTGLEKDDLAARLAKLLSIDYRDLKTRRILQLMNTEEIRTVAQSGIDIQLHTHRHRTPEDQELFCREIRDNRAKVQHLASNHPVHFCYPGGVYNPAFLPWLREEGILSATTCDAGLATRLSESFLLPRVVDNQTRTQTEFESWLTGVGDLLAFRRKSRQRYVPGG